LEKIKLLRKPFVLMTAFILIMLFSSEMSSAGSAISLPLNPFAKECSDIIRILYPNDPPLKGSDVQEVQERLKELGYYNGSCRGIFDASTVESLKKFQKNNNIAPTGWFTEATWNKMAGDLDIPAATEEKLPKGNLKIIIDRNKHTLTLYVNNEEFKTYPVAVGKNSTPTPLGEWKIGSKGINWGTGFGTRWMGLNVPWGTYGIHGTNKPWSIGRNASHGCIRMHNKNVEELFDWIPIGTPVTIIGNINIKYRTLKLGSASQDIVAVQYKLQELGFYWGPADGHFGKMTELSLLYFQALNGLPVDGKIDKKTYEILGL
jgi:peptidoglycan hydrolase-like protein with peptidoglycan-binding domain